MVDDESNNYFMQLVYLLPKAVVLLSIILDLQYSTLSYLHVQFSPVQLLSHVRLFVTPQIAARQASLFITNSRSLLQLMSIESVMPSSHLILCRPLLPPASRPSQHQGLFQWINSLHEVVKVLYNSFALLHKYMMCVPVWLQLCLTLCDPMDCSPPGSSVHGILQARILEWVAMPSSRGSSQPRDQTCVS